MNRYRLASWGVVERDGLSWRFKRKGTFYFGDEVEKQLALLLLKLCGVPEEYVESVKIQYRISVREREEAES